MGATGIQRAVEWAGSQGELARRTGYPQQHISQYVACGFVPKKRAPHMAAISGVPVELLIRPAREPQIGKGHETILSFLRTWGDSTSSVIAMGLGIHKNTARRLLHDLALRGDICREATMIEDRGQPVTLYRLKPKEDKSNGQTPVD